MTIDQVGGSDIGNIRNVQLMDQGNEVKKKGADSSSESGETVAHSDTAQAKERNPIARQFLSQTTVISQFIVFPDPFPIPNPEPPQETVIEGLPEDGVIAGTSGDDTITVQEHEGATAANGEPLYEVTVVDQAGNKTTYLLTAEELQNAKINAGEGNDTIEVDANVSIGLTLIGGDGNDLLKGGSGNDTIIGGDGNDRLLGGDGNDHIDGKAGHDVIQGGDGADNVVGGFGSDAIYADSKDTVNTDVTLNIFGSEFVIADQAEDYVVAQEGATVIAGAEDAVIPITDEHIAQAQAWLDQYGILTGDEDFQQRTLMDIAVMFSTEQGQGLLGEIGAALDESGEKITFTEKGSPGGTYSDSILTISVGSWAELYGNGSQRSPLPVFFHEMVHAWQFLTDNVPEGSTLFSNGDSVKNVELAATGLPWMDENGVVHEVPNPDHPYSDNQFREELGLFERDSYGSTPHGDPVGHVPPGGGYFEPPAPTPAPPPPPTRSNPKRSH